MKNKEPLPGKVLRGHKQERNRIFADWGLGRKLTRVSYTDHVLPEIVHIAMIHDAFGWTEGVPLVLKFLDLATELLPSEALPILSHIGALDGTERSNFVSALERANILEQVSLALSPLSICYPSWPLRFIPTVAIDRKQAVEHLEVCVGRHLHRHFVPSGIALSGLMWWAMNAGKLEISAHIESPNFNAMLSAPDSEIGRKARTDAWLHALGQFSIAGDSISKEWSNRFWVESSRLSECYVFAEEDDEA